MAILKKKKLEVRANVKKSIKEAAAQRVLTAEGWRRRNVKMPRKAK